jgi:bisphosphoglycerate-independent phosphoglycerate mutase (AlkP superfamily)
MVAALKVAVLMEVVSVAHQKAKVALRVAQKADLRVVKAAQKAVLQVDPKAVQKAVQKADLHAMAKGKDARPKVVVDLAKPLPDSALSFNS